MATEPDALTELIVAIEAKRSFKLEAGAGSGKTYALVHVLRHLLDTQGPELRRTGRVIACITYTNVAKDEIRDRIGDDALVQVSTIHDFLWGLIERHQLELRDELVEYNKGLKKPFEELESLDDEVLVTYSNRGRWLPDGRISHDDVIKLAKRMVSKYPKLAKIAADHYPYIFVDEYQDTSQETVDLLLGDLLAAREGRVVIGLFGDSMQSIYSDGVGVVDDERLQVVTKYENYRSSRPVVDLLNKIRPGLRQHAVAKDDTGETLLFLNTGESSPEDRLDRATKELTARGWTVDAAKQLHLTHRLIARNLRYPELDRLYDRRGQNGRRDLLEAREPNAQLLSQITGLRRAFELKDYATLMGILGETRFKVTRHAHKAKLSTDLQKIADLATTQNIGAVLHLVRELDFVPTPKAIRTLEEKEARGNLDERELKEVEFARSLREIPFQEWLNFIEFRDGRTPYSTQHGVKGAEFDDVLVVVDDTAWTQYSMGGMIAGTEANQKRLVRSRNMFYVCCSRARRRLAVVFVSDLPPRALDVARDWFGSQNVFE